MQLIYSLLLTFSFILLLPYFAWQAVFKRKYLTNLKERLGVLPESLRADSRPVIWLHAVSVGEALTARTLFSALHRRLPDYRLVITTTTATGQKVSRDQIKEADGFAYFPFDWKFSVSRAFDTINPGIVILMESELWFNFLSECRTREIPVVVANGRISDRSFPRSMKFRGFVRRLYGLVSRFAMQSRTDAERAIALGANPDSVIVTGNIKYDISTPLDDAAAELDALFSLSRKRLIVAGSTTEGEEEIIIDAFERVRGREGLQDIRLVIAPRHPERFDTVASLLASRNADFTRRSQSTQPGFSGFEETSIILLDTIGELVSVYRFAAVVFVGGSLVPRGGHNILEPASYGKPVIVGPHMENFRDIAAEFLDRDAVIQIRSQVELGDVMIELLENKELAEKLGANALEAIDANRGATARTVEIVAEQLGTHAPSRAHVARDKLKL